MKYRKTGELYEPIEEPKGSFIGRVLGFIALLLIICAVFQSCAGN